MFTFLFTLTFTSSFTLLFRLMVILMLTGITRYDLVWTSVTCWDPVEASGIWWNLVGPSKTRSDWMGPGRTRFSEEQFCVLSLWTFTPTLSSSKDLSALSDRSDETPAPSRGVYGPIIHPESGGRTIPEDWNPSWCRSPRRPAPHQFSKILPQSSKRHAGTVQLCFYNYQLFTGEFTRLSTD